MNQNNKSQWDMMLDWMSVISFVIGLMNLDLNISQEDFDNQTREIDEAVAGMTKDALAEIHGHLKIQDEKIDKILKLLESRNEENQELHGTHQG